MIRTLSLILLMSVGMTDAIPAQGPPIFTDTPIMLGLAGRGLRTFGEYRSTERVKAFTQTFAIPYNVATRTQVGAIGRFVYKEPEFGQSQSGFGDVTLFVKQQILQKDGKGKTFRALVKIAETFPSGDDEVSPALGIGANQTGLSLVGGYITTEYGFYVEIGHVFISDGRPDVSLYNLALSVPLLPQQYPPKQLNLSIDLNGIRGKAGSALAIAPGVQWIIGRRFLVECGIPIYLDEPADQKTGFACHFGLRVLLF